jgi:dynein light chain LC8-type
MKIFASRVFIISDMSEQMQEHAFELAATAIDKFSIEREMAEFIKKEFDAKVSNSVNSFCYLPEGQYGPTWHCVVGRNFGSYVTHESKNFIYFYLGPMSFLLFRCG